ncbi:hypothetical protein CLOM_g15185 [Closterium sp. NIES-68]|nr:hypothetical protein CLOM_g15185 [Closterium sp. NIES-68]GJP73019.1 hypothetical protein CLOP_g3781 [Closterium sp. NIES-67]
MSSVSTASLLSSAESSAFAQRKALAGTAKTAAVKSFQRAAVRCQASSDSSSSDSAPLALPRRQALLTALTAASSPLWVPLLTSSDPALAANIVQRNQRAAYLLRLKEDLFNTISANKELVPDILRLALNDAATYDKETKTGGANGSIRFSEEISRSENKGLKAALQLLEGVKARVDEGAKGGPLSYADLIQFGAQAAVKTTFLAAATRKAGGDPKDGLNLYFAIGSPGQWGFFDKQLGRADADGPDPAGRVPDWEQLSAAEIKEKFARLGLSPRQTVNLALFLGRDLETVEAKLEQDEEMKKWVAKYRQSRKTVSQTNFEVDLIGAFLKLSLLGAPINTEAYTYEPPRVEFKL